MTNEQMKSNQSLEEVALQELIMDPDLERLEDLLAEFNLFDVLGIARRELQHSAFLAWLLDPRGSHGLRDYFLRHFLSQASVEGRMRGIGEFTPFEVDSWTLGDVDIEVATERHRIDILLIDNTDKCVCLIENKIGADEGPRQLRGYLETVELAYPQLRPLPIFLTPEGREPQAEEDAEHWVPFDYERIADLIDRALRIRGSTIGSGIASFLEQYARNLRRHVLDTTDNIDELALQIYNNHRSAIDRIMNAKPAQEVAGWNVIEAAIKEYAPDLQENYRNRGVRSFFSPALDEVAELKLNRMVTFDFHYKENMTLYVYVQPGEQETRERLRQLALYTGQPFHKTRRWGSKWGRIYQRPILRKQDYNPFDPEKAKPKVENAIREFYKNDYWPIVNAIRQEFGLDPVSPD